MAFTNSSLTSGIPSPPLTLDKPLPAPVLPRQVATAERASSHETAISMDKAKRRLSRIDSDCCELTPPATPTDVTTTDRFAFAFDVDGVLIRGGKPIPAAIDAMKVLNGQNEYGIKIPYIFVTNGGGKSEIDRCADLSRQLELEISPGQFICGHTPMRELASKYGTVLVVGGEGERCRHVAESYGFKDVVTPGDIIKANPPTTPFRTLTAEEERNSRTRDFSNCIIEAIFVFADSRDWAGDQQIILDVLLSQNGRLGTRRSTFDQDGQEEAAAAAATEEGKEKENEKENDTGIRTGTGTGTHATPPLYFSHNDLVWSTSHTHSRLGMGALRAGLEAMYAHLTHGRRLHSTVFGKPQHATFLFANGLLRQWRRDTHGIDAPPQTVYFVGDTVESDVRGTNEFDGSGAAGEGNEWFSVLVRTGVYREGMPRTSEPRAVVDDVLGAVRLGIEREMGGT